MLDKKTDAVLQVLNEQAGNGYTVLQKQSLLDLLPPKMGFDMQVFCSIMSFLKEHGYIDVKYHDKETVCLCVTVKTQNHFGGLKETTGTKLVGKQFGLLLVCVGMCAFVGAFLAMVLFQLIF